jgi:hypothetical protein
VFGFTKLFGSLLASTVWREDDKTRIVWITLLAMADQRGVAEGSIPGIADLARVSLEDCEKALARLQEPDRYSRSQDHEGRRIQAVEGGFLVLNYSRYRAKLSEDERREYKRKWAAEKRASRGHDVDTCGQCGMPCGQCGHKQKQKQIQTQQQQPVPVPDPPPVPTPTPEPAERRAGDRRAGQGKLAGRIFLHPWQFAELDALLGPHMETFGLDAWLDDLSAAADAKRLTFPSKDARWKWVLSELALEIDRRGLPVATVAPVPVGGARPVVPDADETRRRQAALRAEVQ